MDGDAFFVGVEVAKNPHFRGLPVVTGEERGIISALSYEIKRGMPIFQIKKNFPQVTILAGDYASYAQYSKRMFDIVRRYADVVEEYSIDECFADLTGLNRPLKMTYDTIAQKIQQEVWDEMNLSVSVGIAPTKVLAKVASKWNKPHGCVAIGMDTKHDFLQKLSIGNVWGIGPQTARYLEYNNIRTAYDFISQSREWVNSHLAKPYEVIWYELQGTPVMVVDGVAKTDYSSIQKTRSFHPTTHDSVFLLSQLSKHIEDACAKARHYGLVARKFSFFLKTKDFVYHSHDVVLDVPTASPEVCIDIVYRLFYRVHTPRVLYRTAGVRLHDLMPESQVQNDLFGTVSDVSRLEIIHHQIDRLEHKLGKRVVHLASTHGALQRKQLGTDYGDIDRDLLFL
jgi:DNA polymerase-4/DNA polymerase V